VLAQIFRGNDQKVIASGQTLELEEDAPHEGGIHTYLSVKVPVHDSQGNIYAVCGMATDITERKRMEEELRIAAVAFDSPMCMMITDENQVIQRVNKAFEEVTGFSSEFAVGRTPRFLRAGKHDEAFYANMWKSIRETGSWQGEIWGRRKNKELYLKWLTISTVRDESGHVTHYVSNDSDITHRKRAEATLLQLNRTLELKKIQLRELVAKNEAVREGERKHIAREVHDELGQVLTALRMDTSFIAMRFGNLDPALDAKILGMRALVDNAIQGVRNVASNLRPMALDMGIYLALDWLCQDFAKRTGVVCLLDAKEKEVWLDDARSIVVFRIVQESLTNISRYAEATQVLVTVGLEDSLLGVEVQDNGKGFDAIAVDAKKTFGLLGMRERALALGGHLDVVSSPGLGTTVSLSVPLERRIEGAER
jgi:PAS domain S-box-containing protein